MLKKEFINTIYEIIFYDGNYISKTDIRVLFHELKDSYHRDGELTENQVQNWILTDRELTKLYNINKLIKG